MSFPTLYNLDEAAALIGENVNTLKARCQRGEVCATWVGRMWFMTETDLLVYLDEDDPVRAEAWRQQMNNGE